MKTCNTCYGYGHLGKPNNEICAKCNGTGITQPKVRAKRTYAESSEVSTISGYIKKHYPDIPVETVKHEGKKARWEQSQHSKQNTSDSFPDTRIYLPNVTLMFEQKAINKPPCNKDGRLKDMHHQYQYNTHKRLFNAHTKVYFTVGISEAIEIFEQALNGIYRPMQIYKDCYEWERQQINADLFFSPPTTF